MPNPSMPRLPLPKSASPEDMEAYEQALILLRICEYGELQVQKGNVVPAAEAFRRVRERLKKKFGKTKPRRRRAKKS